MRIRLTAVAAMTITGAAGGLVMSMLGIAIGSPSGSGHAIVVLRGALPLCLMLLGARVATGWALRAGLRAPLLPVLAGASAGYVLDPFSWSARAGFAQLALDPGPSAYLLDLVIWLAAAALGGVWSAAETSVPDRPLTPYG